MKVVISSLLNIGGGDNNNNSISASSDEYEVQLTASSSGSSRSSTKIMKSQASTDTQSTAELDCDDVSSCCCSSSSSSSYDDHDDGDEAEEEEECQKPLHHQQQMVASSSDRNIHDYYEILTDQIIGEGLYGIVRRCVDRQSGQTYAVKTIMKKQSQSSQQAQRQTIQNEVDIMYQLQQHNGIVGLIDFFEDIQYYHIVTELCHGGELYDMIVQKQMEEQQGDNNESSTSSSSPLFTEVHVGQIIYQILNSIDHLHSKHNIIHRDIKPENILLDNNGNLKLIDFGLSVKTSSTSTDNELLLNDVVGTPYYMSPELLKNTSSGYEGKPCDIWSIGVLTYILLFGYPPFGGDNDLEVMENVKRGHYSIDNTIKLSRDAKHFIKSLLKRDPRRRLNAKQAMNHPWIIKQMK